LNEIEFSNLGELNIELYIGMKRIEWELVKELILRIECNRK